MRDGYRALVWGSSGALGGAFVRALQADARCAQVQGVCRASFPEFDLERPQHFHDLMGQPALQGPWHLVVDATGMLHTGEQTPEKHLGAVRADHLLRSYAINAVGPLLLMQACAPQLALGERVVWAKLSARVGSIGDNRKGGWYAYRAAKAGLNMLLQTAAIELQRRRPRLVVAALQPGTVASALSQPFVAAEQALTPEASVAGLLATLQALPEQPGAQFVDYRGGAIPW